MGTTALSPPEKNDLSWLAKVNDLTPSSRGIVLIPATPAARKSPFLQPTLSKETVFMDSSL